MSAQVPEHVVQNGIVLDRVKLLYVPIPRAGSTSILWALATLAGIPNDDIVSSAKPEVTRALTVHDFSRWEDACRLSTRSESERDEILRSADWLRFTVVREPVTRIWSAWVAKLLLREPRFVAEFGTEDWFPGTVASPEDLVGAFRRFVAALDARPETTYSQHWAAQADLAGINTLDYAVIGRLDELPGTLASVNEHVRRVGAGSLVLGRKNAALVPFSAAVLDAATAETCRAWSERDAEAFGYTPLAAADEPDPGWHATVEALMPSIRAVVERNERIGDLSNMLMHSRAS